MEKFRHGHFGVDIPGCLGEINRIDVSINMIDGKMYWLSQQLLQSCRGLFQFILTMQNQRLYSRANVPAIIAVFPWLLWPHEVV